MMLARNTFPLNTAEGMVRNQRIMLVEDEEMFARAVSKTLRKAGFESEVAHSIADARKLFKQFAPDLVLLDMRLPDGNGMDLLPELIAKGAAVIVMTAYGEVGDAVNAMKVGATDYLKKPIDLEELLLIVDKAQQSEKLKHQVDYSRQRDHHALEGVELLGESPGMRMVREQIEKISKLSDMADAPSPMVLIMGGTGTGKDVAARLLHQQSRSADRPFVQVDCASLPAELIESELFGHEKGAYTSAQAERCGLIEAAEDGTLFLDEVGELPLTLQAKLLNVLERRMVRRLGANKERPVRARFLAATNRDLQQMVLEGRFRADLFYRLHVLTITMPLLKERDNDVLLLAQHFLTQTERRYGLPGRRFSPEAVDLLTSYDWPGNVRELKHVVGRAALLCAGTDITPADMGMDRPAVASAPAITGLTVDEAERQLMEDALQATRGNVSAAARRLGLSRMAMRYRMERHGLKG